MNLLLPPKIARFKFNFNLLKKNIFVFLLLMPSVFAFSQYQTNNSGGAWENISSWVTPRPSPSTDPDDGVLSSDWYSINGTITRSGSITQNVTTIINGTLEVSGDYIITGGQLTIIGKLIVHGNNIIARNL